VRDLATIVAGRGGSWSPAGVILYSADITGLIYRIPAEGGTPEPATAIANDSGGITHRLPYFLPDGKTFLFTQGLLNGNEGTVEVARLGSTESHRLMDFPTNVAYAAGRLLYVKDGLLMAQRVRRRKGQTEWRCRQSHPRARDLAVPIPRQLLDFLLRPAGVSASAGQPYAVELVRSPLRGSHTLVDPGPYRLVRVSPRGDRILVERGDRDGSLTDVWLYEPAGKAWARITSHPDIYYGLCLVV
jgi:hypothetical protein